MWFSFNEYKNKQSKQFLEISGSEKKTESFPEMKESSQFWLVSPKKF
jgi:hypothetical protein